MNKTQKQRKNIKEYDSFTGLYLDINKVPKEIKEKIPETLLEEYFNNIKQLEHLNKKITEYTKKWVETQDVTIKIEEAINKLLK